MWNPIIIASRHEQRIWFLIFFFHYFTIHDKMIHEFKNFLQFFERKKKSRNPKWLELPTTAAFLPFSSTIKSNTDQQQQAATFCHAVHIKKFKKIVKHCWWWSVVTADDDATVDGGDHFSFLPRFLVSRLCRTSDWPYN